MVTGRYVGANGSWGALEASDARRQRSTVRQQRPGVQVIDLDPSWPGARKA
jgi:hypothetical protein